MIIKIVIKTIKKEIVVNKKYNLDLSFDNYVFNIYILFKYYFIKINLFYKI